MTFGKFFKPESHIFSLHKDSNDKYSFYWNFKS